jgi:hypothetical protein
LGDLALTNNAIDFPGWRVETLESFVSWLFTGRVQVKGLDTEYNIDMSEALSYDAHRSVNSAVPNGQGTGQQTSAPHPWYAKFPADPVAQTLGRVLDLYAFSIVGCITVLATECILVWQRLLCSPYNVVVYAPLINAAIDRCGTHSNPLCSFLLEWTAFNMREDIWDRAELVSLPPHLLGEILRLVLKRANSGVETDSGVPNPNFDWCRYHGHVSTEERDACRARRPNDRDIRHVDDELLDPSTHLHRQSLIDPRLVQPSELESQRLPNSCEQSSGSEERESPSTHPVSTPAATPTD